MKKHLLPLLPLLLVVGPVFAGPPSVATRPATSRQAFVTSTKTTVASSPNPSTVGASVTFTASVVDNFGFSFPIPVVNEGTVTFSEGATVLAANVPVVAGVASFSTSSLAVGVHAITAVYSGTTNFGTSTGSMAQTVDGTGPCPTYSGNIAYVNASVPVGTNDGTTWANAFLTLQEALDAARTCGVTQIWVAQGTYLPTTYPIGAATSTSFGGGTLSSTDFSFHLVDGVAIYGGFSGSGTETQLSQRNWRQNPTLLSGSNALNHVVTSASDGLATRLDGFTITGGRANATTQLTVEGQFFSGTVGGGMYLNNSSLTLNNLLITGNSCPATDFTGGQGGGMAMQGGSSVLTNVAFVGNSAYSGGGLSASSTFTMTNGVFSGNTANAGGGGMIVSGGSRTLTNVVFANNAATRTGNFGTFGGAMTNNGGGTTLVNCTFFGNSSGGAGGVMYNVNGANVTNKNGIFYGNSAPTSPDVHNNPNPNDPLSYTATTTLTGTDPKFVNSADPDGPDNLWMTADDGLALQSTSPAVNAGTAAGAPPTDILGVTRTGNPDQGAYEYNPCVTPTAFAVTGGGGYCAGGSGVAIGLSGSETGVSYQLKLNGNPEGSAVPGTGSALSLGTFTAAGTYTVVASRSETCTANMTGSATVTVNPNPSLSSATASPNPLCVGQTLTLTASASGGTGPLTYDWSGPDGYNPDPTTTNPLTRPNATAAFAGAYAVTVSDQNGCQASGQTQALAVLAGASVSITTPSQFVCAATDFTLNTTATGATAYQWYRYVNGKGDLLLAGATSPTLTVNLTTSAAYYVVVSGTCGGDTSNVVMLTLKAPTVLTTTGNPTAVCRGASVTLSVGASGPGPLSFAWRRGAANGPLVSTANSLTIQNAQPSDAGPYFVSVTSECATQTAQLPLTVRSVTITQQPPASVNLCSGNTTLTVGVQAVGVTPTYQWRRNGQNLFGATSASLVVPSSRPGSYTVVVSSVCGNPVTSEASVVGCNPGRLSVEAAALVVAPNPVAGREIRVRVSGMDDPSFSLTSAAGRSLGISVKTDGSGEWVLTPKQSLAPGVYVLQASEGQTRLTQRVLVVE